MRLHENQSDFEDLIAITSQNLGIDEIYVEKDYFVVLALKSLSQTVYKKNGIFKGGTSLSKAYKIINRFSEDIDLAIVNDNGTGKGSQNKMKHVENSLTSNSCFTVDSNHERVRKTSRLRQVVYDYPKVGSNRNYGQISPHVFIDISTIMPGVPFEEKNITSYIHDYLESQSLTQTINDYALHGIEVNTLKMERTFAEKLVATVKYSTQEYKGDQPIDRLKKGIRHVYDLHQMLSQETIQRFYNEGEQVSGKGINEFIDMVIKDDSRGAPFMDTSFQSCLLYDSPEDIWEALRSTYEGEFSRMIFGNTPRPTSQDMITSLQILKKICKQFDNWKISNGIVYG